MSPKSNRNRMSHLKVKGEASDPTSTLKAKLDADAENRTKISIETTAARNLLGYGPIRLCREEGNDRISVSIEVGSNWYVVIDEYSEYPDRTVYPSGMVDEILRKIK